MILTMPADQRARLMQMHYNVHLNIQMVPSGGGIFNPTSRLLSGKINANMDQACATVELTFNRGKGGIANAFDNLSPLISASDWNASGPLMYGGNFISLECCITAPGAAPDVFSSFFIGRLDTVDIGGDEVIITARDAGAYALDRQIKYAAPYGEAPMDDVMQSIMDANGFDPGTHFTQEIADTEFTIVQYMQQPGSLLEALRIIAQQRGLDFRYFMRNGRLTLYDPDRDRVGVDSTFSANEYMTVDRLQLDDVDVRNQVEVWYGQGTAATGRVYVEDSASMLQHGPRFTRIVMGRSRNVVTLAQATAFAGYALADMKDPLADHQVTLPFFPIVELNDFYEYVANQDHYDANQKWAISGYTHEFSLDDSITTFQTRGKPMAAFRDYRRGEEDKLVVSTEDAPTGTYLDGTYFPEGYMWAKTPDLLIP
jgi:hypothetical protein